MGKHDANPKPELPGLREAWKLLKAAKRKPTEADAPAVSTLPPHKPPPQIEGQLTIEDALRDRV